MGLPNSGLKNLNNLWVALVSGSPSASTTPTKGDKGEQRE